MTGPDSRTPNPVSQWLGLVTGAVDEARTLLGRIPGQLMRLPLVALSAALELRERLRREQELGTPGGQPQRPSGPGVDQPGLADVRQLRPPAVAPPAPGAPPLADFDTMTLASLRGRLRVLDLPTLTRLRDWESAHAARAAILAMLDHRIDKLSGIG